MKVHLISILVALLFLSVGEASGALARPSGAREIDNSASGSRVLDKSLFSSPSGWSMEMVLQRNQLAPGSSLFNFSNGEGQGWLEGTVDGSNAVRFSLRTEFQAEPLTIGIPMALLPETQPSDMVIRYRGYSFELFCNGVLVDEEWPIGKIEAANTSVLTSASPLRKLMAWDRPLSDAEIVSMSGGGRQVSSNTLQILGAEPQRIQYSRPRGYNTNAGDAMPFYHNGAFHLYFLLDRRHHKSKWGLGAHQWAHISSTDLVHWTNHPIALAVDHEWEGSICTGSIFFHDGKYYAFYATRMPDRNQRLAIAESRDGIHFTKELPTPFDEPKPPYVRGPNRDPFVFVAGGRFHMIVTAAVSKDGGRSKEGALEHLVSSDLKQWTVEKEPLLTSGSELEPECSDLFQWGDWYYLLYSLGGTTHYRMAHDPLGPWNTPVNDILDAPEAKVMKAAPFKDGRMLAVGFVQYDKRYGGTLIFRELVRQADGTLGTTTPPEMRFPESGRRALETITLDGQTKTSRTIALEGATHFHATVTVPQNTKLTLHLSGDNPDSRADLIFDPSASAVAWTDHSLQSEPARLDHVGGLASSVEVELILAGSLADLAINGQRSMIHRLPMAQASRMSFSIDGTKADITNIEASQVEAPLQPATP